MERTVLRIEETDSQNWEPYPLCTCEGTSHLTPGAIHLKHGGIRHLRLETGPIALGDWTRQES